MKYAVFVPADQTIAFVTSDRNHVTTVHSEALLLDSREEAVILAEDVKGYVEDVEDQVEFCSREDTW